MIEVLTAQAAPPTNARAVRPAENTGGMAAALSIIGGTCEVLGLLITALQIRADYRTAETILDAAAGEWEKPSRTRYRHQRPGRPRVAGHTLEAELGGLSDEISEVANELEGVIAEGDNALREYIRRLLVGGIRIRLLGLSLVGLGIALATAGAALAA